MKYGLLVLLAVALSSCWKWQRTPVDLPQTKVFGYRPVYQAVNQASLITYIPQKQPVHAPGNIYAFGNRIFQVDIGRGIHVIDNSNPQAADRVGFITAHGCSQISIKGQYLYTNVLADLVTLDLAASNGVAEVSRVANALPEFRYHYPMSEPEGSGYFVCPRYDSIVVGWVQDSILASCRK